MIHALLPVYLVVVLGTSTMTVGIIEGITEATAAITKVFSGALSDRLGKRKLLAAASYGLAALTKPIFPLAETVGWLIGARFIDRIGKGIRGAPRDALVADLAPADMRGAAFGLRQALDTVGAFAGPLWRWRSRAEAKYAAARDGARRAAAVRGSAIRRPSGHSHSAAPRGYAAAGRPGSTSYRSSKVSQPGRITMQPGHPAPQLHIEDVSRQPLRESSALGIDARRAAIP